MIKFGTGGWRAIIGDEFTKANIQLFAKAMANKMKAENNDAKGIVIGYDRRFLSKETVKWICEIMASEGIHTYFVSRSVPTPLIMNYVSKHDLPYGLMVTASHNPSLYNGIKVFTKGGRDAEETQTKDIERYIENIEQTNEPIEGILYEKALELGFVTEFYPMNEYIDDIIEKIDVKRIREAQLRIVLDPMYGVSATALNTILTTSRCHLDIIHQEHDTLFGGKMPAPSADRLNMLRTCVLDGNFDLGIATDGDADRLGVIDDQGNYLHPNDILVLLYYYLLKYKGWTGPCVRNLATTHRMDAIAEKFGQKCYEVPVGFKHISAKMAETGAVIGGESSGGLTVSGHIKGKDGVYAASLLVEMVAVTGLKLSELIENIRNEFGNPYMEEISYSFSEETKRSLMKRLFQEKELPDLSPFCIRSVSYLDGCKMLFQDGGWAIIRFSGTEPILRVFCEMESKEQTDYICNKIKNYFNL
ncbi:MAG: phosphoglucomutase/phosphomannomutase family protein [Clostridia bacterium]|nr:phosphoglucomutase/phosphomannomutase family protein [Clostridia bacterium]